MRTHVYTQGGKPMLAALGHVAQLGFAACLAVWAVLRFALRGRELPLYKLGRALAAVIVLGAAVLTMLANFMPGFPVWAAWMTCWFLTMTGAPTAARPGASPPKAGWRSPCGASCSASAPA